MYYFLGFLIATAIGLTGVGAGSLAAPVLILFAGLPPAVAVGTALAFSAVVKLAVAPLYLWQRQVSFRTLRLLSAGGVPGVLAGFWGIGKLGAEKHQTALFVALGATIATMALYTLYRTMRKGGETGNRDRSQLLPLIAAGIGAEVGFSSAGAGALGSVVLMSLTRLTAAEVIGTDMLFGLILSVLGGGLHVAAGQYNSIVLWQLVIGGLGGAFSGAVLSIVLPRRPLRIALSAWLALLGAQLCWRGLG